jgi:hypothetical protein
MNPILLEANCEAREIVRRACDERDATIRQAELDAKAEIQRYADETAQKLQRLEDEVQQSVDAGGRGADRPPYGGLPAQARVPTGRSRRPAHECRAPRRNLIGKRIRLSRGHCHRPPLP